MPPAMHRVKAPWIRPGVVVHDPSIDVDGLLAEFALTLQRRGFRVAGFVQLNNRQRRFAGSGCAERIEWLDLATGDTVWMDRHGGDANGSADRHAVASLGAVMRDEVDLVVISRFAAMETAAERLMASVEDGLAQGLPLLTSIAGCCLDRWYRFTGHGGAMLSPTLTALWHWWGAERLYQDLALGVADAPVRRILCGPRWLMIEGPDGVGLSPLPKGPAPLLPRLPKLQRMSLRALAALTQSWDAQDLAVGIAAINAHYNRFDLEAAFGNGASTLRGVDGRTLVIGGFPGLNEILPHAQVIEAQPRPGELPAVAIDTVLPGSAAAVVSANSLVNRTLPRILRLAQGTRLALIGPAAPMTPRLHGYGVELIGGLRVHDPDGIAEVVASGGAPRDFERFGHFVHIRNHAAGSQPTPACATVPHRGVAVVRTPASRQTMPPSQRRCASQRA